MVRVRVKQEEGKSKGRVLARGGRGGRGGGRGTASNGQRGAECDAH